MNINDALSISDIEQLAKRRLPRVVYEGIASGVEDERGITRNETEFHRYRLLPYHLIDVSTRTQSTTLFGRAYASPFGISPTGIAGIFRRDAELMLAKAAAGANVPFIMSGASMVSIERVQRLTQSTLGFRSTRRAIKNIGRLRTTRARRRIWDTRAHRRQSGFAKTRTRRPERIPVAAQTFATVSLGGAQPPRLGL